MLLKLSFTVSAFVLFAVSIVVMTAESMVSAVVSPATVAK